MDNKLSGLLLKLRKGATSAFTTKDWIAILLSFGFQVDESGRGESKQVQLTAPNGAQILIKKDPRRRAFALEWFEVDTAHKLDQEASDEAQEPLCRCGDSWPCAQRPERSLLSLQGWAKDQGSDLKLLACQALGLPTPAQEKEEKAARERDWTHTGTCGVCGQNVKMAAGGARTELVHHGFQRPGDGAILGDCFGVGYAPYELSPAACEAFLRASILPTLADAEATLAKFRAGTIVSIQPLPPYLGAPWPKKICAGDIGWEGRVNSEMARLEREIAALTRDKVAFEAKIAGWQLRELPEVVMARRFGPKA